MEYTRGLFGGFSSEGCFDFANKYLDFGLYVCFGDGFGREIIPIADRLIPFFEITYHGILLYNATSPTVNYTIKDARERLTLYMRGGKPAMYYYSRFRTGGATNWMGEVDLVCGTDDELRESVSKIKEAAEEYAPHADRKLVYMDRYDFLDSGLEVATYEDGSRVVGNFTGSPINLIEYRNKKRMELAKHLLRLHSVSEVSELIGYQSIYAFSRAYKNYFEYAPSKKRW